MMLAILITNIDSPPPTPFYAILFTPYTFTVKYEIFLLHYFDTETLFQTNKIDDNTNKLERQVL